MALVATVLTTGCIKDDLDDCDNVTIYFQYLADGDKDVLYQYMRRDCRRVAAADLRQQ